MIPLWWKTVQLSPLTSDDYYKIATLRL